MLSSKYIFIVAALLTHNCNHSSDWIITWDVETTTQQQGKQGATESEQVFNHASMVAGWQRNITDPNEIKFKVTTRDKRTTIEKILTCTVKGPTSRREIRNALEYHRTKAQRSAAQINRKRIEDVQKKSPTRK